MKPIAYGFAALLCYVAFVLHGRGENVYSAVMVFAAGVAYGVTKQESPPG